jgi:hypothetical protein
MPDTPTPTSLPTQTYEPLPPTWTPTHTNTPEPTRTRIPYTATNTPVLIVTATSTPYADIIEITHIPSGTNYASLFFTPTATLRINYLYRYVLQSEPYPVRASDLDPQKTCEWSGVGGEVLDIQGNPVPGINVRFGGSINGVELETLTTLTGTAEQYGESGYEFKIADEPFDTFLSLWVQLVDENDEPLSAKTPFSAYNDCDNNLIIINFKQVR